MNKRPVSHYIAGLGMAGALASAMLFIRPALARGDSDDLAGRMDRLEQSLANRNQSNLNLLNQVQDLQSQVQQLQGQIEELRHQQQQAGDQGKAQYLDLDSRLGRLEGRAAAGAAGAAASSEPGASKQAKPTKPEAKDRASSAGQAQVDYAKAIATLRAGRYADAGRQFGDFLARYPNDALASNALYWQGECYYADARYQTALVDFQQLLQHYPASDKAPDALLKLGYTQDQLKQSAAAAATLKSVIAKYPHAKVAELAKERLQSIQLQAATP